MLEQLPGDGRNPAGDVDPLALDDLERLERIPFAHEDGGVADRHRSHQARAAGADMEERDDHQPGPAAPAPAATRRDAMRFAPSRSAHDNMLVRMLRWVPSAPFGLPVVPLV